ncbi:hypothetical protein BH10ACT10_BH10ACT10_15400 [soil metagenome]
MATFTRSDDLQGAEFVDADLSVARFARTDLSGAVLLGVDLAAADIEAPWALTLERAAGMPASTVEVEVDGAPEEFTATRRNPHAPAHPETVLSCLHVILGEEWEHHPYAVRDLDAIAAGSV